MTIIESQAFLFRLRILTDGWELEPLPCPNRSSFESRAITAAWATMDS